MHSAGNLLNFKSLHRKSVRSSSIEVSRHDDTQHRQGVPQYPDHRRRRRRAVNDRRQRCHLPEEAGSTVYPASVYHEKKGPGMLKIISCFTMFLLLIMSGGLALADTFKCTRPDGTVFFTNDPSQAPSGCVIERVTDLPPLGIIPDAPMQQPAAPVKRRSSASQAQTAEKNLFEPYKNEAALLVEKFQSARQSVFRSSFVTDKLQARRELTDIRAQKAGLLSEIKQSSLSPSEKTELENLLSTITE